MKESEGIQVLIYFDGASRSNPGPSGAGWTIRASNGIKENGCKYLGRMTNNEAEYHSLLLALDWVVRHLDSASCHLFMKGDSQLIARQLTGEYAVKNARLRILFDKVMDHLKTFLKWEIEWIPRDDNVEADYLANKAFDRNRPH